MVSRLSRPGTKGPGHVHLGRDPLRPPPLALAVECLPATLEANLLFGGDRAIGTVLAQESEAETVGFVSSVDDGASLVEPSLAGIEVGVADGRAVARGVIADLVESVAESRLSTLGDLAQTFGVAGFVRDQVEASQGPDLTAFAEAIDGNDGGLVAGGEECADARDRIEKAGVSVGNQVLNVGYQGRDAVTEPDIGLVVGLETLGALRP